MTSGPVHDLLGPAAPVEPLRAVLRRILDDAIGVSGAVVCTADGMLVAAELRGGAPQPAAYQPEAVAALAAAAAGVAIRFAHLLTLGDTVATVVDGARGCVAVQELPGHGVLVLFGNEGTTLARLHLAVRQAVPAVMEVLRENLR
ncbi:hypothetical protein ACL02T_02800 [Pseudonocardia sp. RS010]|uniref:hypothetical protein n=1 Tax=Pseudonocardia sp. RS010 TaxID=3385979 RepID=UPI0039A095D0